MTGPILHTFDGGHPAQTMRVYLRTRGADNSGSYNATRLAMCPVCGATVEVEKGAHKLPWCDGETFWVAHPDELEYRPGQDGDDL